VVDAPAVSLVDLIRSPSLLPLLLLGFVLAMPLFAGAFWLRQVTLISIMALVVVGLNLSYGFAGELALGQAATYAAGAYTTAILATHGQNELAVTLPLAALVAALIGLLSGLPGLRLGGWSLAMTSFFLVLLVPSAVNIDPGLTGGLAGIFAIPRVHLFGRQLDPVGYYLTVVVSTALVFAAFRNFVRSRHGAALRTLRLSPVLSASLGMSVYRTKLLAYVLGAVPAGIAGCLFAYLDGFVAPESFGFGTAIAFLAASILGGSQSIYGALVGASLLQLGPLRSTAVQRYSLVVYGAFLIVGGVLLSGGVAGLGVQLVARLRRRRKQRPGARGGRGFAGSFPGLPLEVDEVSKHFGGVVALDRVTLRAEPREITAIIGANGSGKTTLLNLVSGFYRADAGSVRLGENDLARLRPYAVARRGVCRTFQTPSVPAGLTAAEVVATARYVRPWTGVLGTMLRLPRFRRVRADDRVIAVAALELVGLGHLADADAASLPLGTRRLLELGRGVASPPSLLLLDEPAAGLDARDLVELVRTVRAIRDGGGTVVLVEHNVPLVLDLADRVYVLRGGRVIASGTPAEIRGDATVAATYLGRPVEAR
jgi:branched-chain amino acid transport system permease protein